MANFGNSIFLLWCCVLCSLSGLGQTKSQLRSFAPLPNETGKQLQLTEVTHSEYNRFLAAVRSVNQSQVIPFLPDSAEWLNTKNPGGEALRDYYGWHPAYKNYPVVNITHMAAIAYCEWLTQEYNAINARGAGVFKKIRVRLPTEEEWQTAARGLLNETAKNFQTTEPKNLVLPWTDYPYWNFPDAKGKFRANTKFETGAENTGFVYSLDGFTYTGPVKSYRPTDGGFYDLIGNVAEMVAEPGLAKGGSWDHTITECFIDNHISYSRPSPRLGFRVLLEIVEP